MRAKLGLGVQKDLSYVHQHRERAGLVIAFLTAASSNNVSFGEIGAHKRDKEEKNMTEILNVVKWKKTAKERNLVRQMGKQTAKGKNSDNATR